MGESHAYDVLVVGGGATGAGVLRDLARRGLRTLLIERGDYGTGTTADDEDVVRAGLTHAAHLDLWDAVWA
jgi:glycerol-3-phosphate dehydrogenase